VKLRAYDEHHDNLISKLEESGFRAKGLDKTTTGILEELLNQYQLYSKCGFQRKKWRIK
jgi:hypothetical protein